jgi:RecB family endonuclease NucS
MPKEQRYALIDPAKKTLAHQMAMEEPKDWRLPSNVPLAKYAEAWANEILPIAREAHERLVFKDVKPLP